MKVNGEDYPDYPLWHSVRENPPRTDSYLVTVLTDGVAKYYQRATYSEVDGWEINGVIAWAEEENVER